MTLTDALHICRMMPPAEVHAYRGDPMLESVCRWRREHYMAFRRLLAAAKLVQIADGTVGRFEAILSDGASHTVADLCVRTGATRMAAVTALGRLRRQGAAIQRVSGGRRQAPQYRLN